MLVWLNARAARPSSSSHTKLAGRGCGGAQQPSLIRRRQHVVWLWPACDGTAQAHARELLRCGAPSGGGSPQEVQGHAQHGACERQLEGKQGKHNSDVPCASAGGQQTFGAAAGCKPGGERDVVQRSAKAASACKAACLNTIARRDSCTLAPLYLKPPHLSSWVCTGTHWRGVPKSLPFQPPVAANAPPPPPAAACTAFRSPEGSSL